MGPVPILISGRRDLLVCLSPPPRKTNKQTTKTKTNKQTNKQKMCSFLLKISGSASSFYFQEK